MFGIGADTAAEMLIGAIRLGPLSRRRSRPAF
jgi:hypothetical protein